MKKAIVLILSGLMAIGSFAVVYADSPAQIPASSTTIEPIVETVSINVGETIISKGNSSGTTENLKDYILISGENGGISLRKGDSHKVQNGGEYTIKGEYEIDKTTVMEEEIDCSIGSDVADKLSELCTKTGMSKKEILEKAILEICETCEETGDI